MELFQNEPSQLINTFITDRGKEKKISREEIFNTNWLKHLLVSVSNGVDKKKRVGEMLKTHSFFSHFSTKNREANLRCGFKQLVVGLQFQQTVEKTQ